MPIQPHNPPCPVTEIYQAGQCRVCWRSKYNPVDSQLPKIERVVSAGGVGSELSRILAWFGYVKDGNCKCGERAAEMDRRGVAWCESNQNTILDWLEDSARERGERFVRLAASMAVKAAIVAAKIKLSDAQLYPCIHRSEEQVVAKGCGSCSGLKHVHPCNNQKLEGKLCMIDGPNKTLNTARANGYMICSECGFREPEETLEMPVTELRSKLLAPVGTLPAEWPSWKASKHAIRESFLEVCKTLSSSPKKINGRGVVIAAGGDLYFPGAWAVTHVLRYLGCKLPIQWWYLGEEEMDRRMLDLASSLDVQTFDATSFSGLRNKGGWELKPFSVMNSGFEEVLYLDADCIPAYNPERLFDSQQFQTLGSVFWPDLPQPNGKPWIEDSVWERFGLTPDHTPDFESGQFLVNVRACWKELQATMWLNNYSEYVYQHVYGDKSTFHLAWRGCGRAYGMPSKLAGWKRPCIQQYDFNGELAFNHACRGKILLGHGVLIPDMLNGYVAADSVKNLRETWKGLYASVGSLKGKSFLLQNLSTSDCWPVTLEGNRKLKGGPPFLNLWGWDADKERVVLIGQRGKNKAVVDFLYPKDGGWIGISYRLT